MKKNLLFFLFLSVLTVYGQTGRIISPAVWYRADSVGLSDGAWQNTVSGAPPALSSGGIFTMPDSLLNFNPAFWIGGENSFVVPALPLSSSRVTAIMVYQTPNESDEMGLWEILNPLSNVSVGLSTQRILGSRGGIRYGSANETRTIINTLSQTWKDEKDSVPGAQLGMANFDTLVFEGLVSEFLLFDKELSNKEIVSWISYLAVKYGVTLFQTNYVNSEDSVIWNYTGYPDYSFSIAGIGRDDERGLFQKQSYMLHDRIIAGLGNPAVDNAGNGHSIDNLEFLLWGFDSTGLDYQEALYGDMGEEYLMYGHGLLQRTGNQIAQSSTFMVVDGTEWEDDLWNYYLLIDRTGSGDFNVSACEWIAPDFVDSLNRIHYRNILWDTDGSGRDHFCFLYDGTDSLLSSRSAMADNSGDDSTGKGSGSSKSAAKNGTAEHNATANPLGENKYKLYPNPNSGSYNLEIDYQESSAVTVKIYNSAGQLIEEKSGNAGRQHYFKGYLPVKGHYLIEVRGQTETKSFKLVVN